MRSALALAVLLPTLALAADSQADVAKKKAQQFVDLLMKVKQSEPGTPLSKADQEANQKVFAELDTMFDWDYLILEPIKPRADKFSPAEKDEFNKKFKEVIRLVAYPDSGAFFRKAKWKFTDAKDKGEKGASVAIEAKREDLETKVDLQFHKVGADLKLYDVEFDGDSLVKDYQNQMVRIVDKGGAKELIGKVDKRKADLEKPKK